MQDTSVFQALEVKDSFITNLQNLLDSESHVKIFLHWDKELSQSEIADHAGVSTGTVSMAKSNLKELKLLEEGGDGLEKSIEAFSHPVVKEAYLEAIKNE
jgi:DNA-binding MarR family transcriptional regulator